ncbi:MAG: ribonuclease E/G, partial [Bauldia sp.]
MANKMLIDAAHPEETRVVVLRGNRVEEFDFESASRRQLRGNIYLAKVTRVEPSLQAAFVEYGGNRHGFLAFSEIHPDYYQIPVADRQALIEAEEREIREAEERGGDGERAAAAEPATPVEGAAAEAVAAEAGSPPLGEVAASPNNDGEGEAAAPETAGRAARAAAGAEEVESDERIESVGAEDAMEEVPERRKARLRQYKIQEVIKRRQILLVQVVKEERGGKGAALTSYLSLAGRYCVLMPNTARGGGISRKITSLTDRKRLKQVVSDLEVADGMGVILRTAGASRTKAEVKRDFEYLLRLWESVRELTLRSTAPALVYEEGSLIKRSIRDLYNKDIDEILVAGDEAYREAKEFMRMLMPSHAKNVKPYRESQPILARSGIEAQLDAMFSPQVTLKSGGYVVINQTEALVSIDVNSGRATGEHSIEDTALQTNLEASDEIARQLRLRDLAGLIVIDFIDMEEKRNNRAVERRLKEALKNDRARIQVGRISH